MPAYLFQSPNVDDNARQALAVWEANPAATILTNGSAYLVCRDAVASEHGWRQTSPEEIERHLQD